MKLKQLIPFMANNQNLKNEKGDDGIYLLQKRTYKTRFQNERQWLKFFNRSSSLLPIFLIASDIGSTRFGLFKKGSGKDDESDAILEHPLLEQLRYTDQTPYEMSVYSQFYLYTIYLLTVGYAPIYIHTSDEGLEEFEFNFTLMDEEPRRLVPIPPSWIAEHPSLSDPFYTLTPPGRLKTLNHIPESKVRMIKHPNPNDPFFIGIGRAQAVADEVETQEEAIKFALNAFYNGAAPDIILKYSRKLRDADKKKIKQGFMDKFRGRKKSHGVTVIDDNNEIIKLDNKFGRELELNEIRKQLRKEVANNFGVANEVMGDTDKTNKNNYILAIQHFEDRVLDPLMKMQEDFINKMILPMYENTDDLEFRFIFKKTKHKELNSKMAREQFMNGIATNNEARIMTGKEPLEGGDFLLLPLNMIPVPVVNGKIEPGAVTSFSATNHPNVEETVDEGAEKPANEDVNRAYSNIKAAIEKQNDTGQQWQQRMNRLRTQLEIENAPKLYNFLLEQGDRITRTLIKMFDNKAVSDLDDNFWVAEELLIQDIITPVVNGSITAGWTAALEFYKQESPPVDFSEFSLNYSIEQSKYITDTTREKVTSIIVEGLEQQLSTLEISEQIALTIQTEAFHRADAIAKTVIHSSSIEAQQNYAIGAGASKKRWLSAGDERVRDAHAVFEAFGFVNMDFEYATGLFYPGQPGADAEQVIRCRCDVLYEFN